LDRLETRGLVRRERSEQDRRLVFVHITKAGSDLLAPLDEPILELHRAQMNHLTRAELATLKRLLEKLRRPVIEATDRVREKACSP